MKLAVLFLLFTTGAYAQTTDCSKEALALVEKHTPGVDLVSDALSDMETGLGVAVAADDGLIPEDKADELLDLIDAGKTLGYIVFEKGHEEDSNGAVEAFLVMDKSNCQPLLDLIGADASHVRHAK